MTDGSHDETLRVQYREVYEWMRQNERFMWQIPTLLTLIVGTLVAVTFTFMREYYAPLWAREGVLAIALVLTVVMVSIQRRYRYFGRMMVGTLSSIEYELNVKHVQKTAWPCRLEEQLPGGVLYPSGLYYRQLLRKRDGAGENALFLAMLFMALIIAVLMVLLCLMPDSRNAISCTDIILSRVVVGLSFVLAPLIVIIDFRKELKKATVSCLRCKHKWVPLEPNPKTCPNCKSSDWNKPEQGG